MANPMWSWFKGKRSENPSGGGASKRRTERLETAVLTCELGTILDVSKSGMRVRTTRGSITDASGMRVIELCAPADSITLKVRLIRSERCRGGWHEHAIEFVDLDPSQESELENLARTGRRRPTGSTLAGDRRDLVLEAVRMPDYYAVLGLSPAASMQDVHNAFRQLARTYHPDVNQDPAAQTVFCSINEAHEVLGDEGQRADYDALYRLRPAA